jgi:hypothetical protein
LERPHDPSLYHSFADGASIRNGSAQTEAAVVTSRRERCSDFDRKAGCARRVLLVGAERRDEFADAMRLARRGHDVLVINPRETAAATRFREAGGQFVRSRVEALPPACCSFDLICENYPYPSGRQYVPPRAFALARLTRLRPAGRWILFTESPRYSSLLKAIGDYDDEVRRRFRTLLSRIPPDEAPLSTYPMVSSRFRLVFWRRR